MHCTDTTRQTYKASRLGMEVYEDVKLVDVQVFTHPVFGNIVKAFPVTVNEEFAEVREVKMKRYELNSHQSSVQITVSDRKLSVQQGTTTQTAFYTADVISYGDYYSFGMLKPGRHGNSDSYRYSLQSKEKDDEWAGEGNSIDFGARMYDPRLGRWRSMDRLAHAYPSLSPYCFVGNTPIMAIDPDGERIIFVNGYNNQRSWWPGTGQNKRDYWSENFIEGARKYFGETSENYQFVDGRGKHNSSGSSRYTAGYEYAKANLTILTDGMAKGETIKIVSHSMGAAYSEGMIQFLQEKGFNVEKVVHFSPSDGDDFKANKEPNTIQLTLENDPVLLYKDFLNAGVHDVANVDMSGIVNTPENFWKDFIDNHTRTRTDPLVWNMVRDLETITFEQKYPYFPRTAGPSYNFTVPDQKGFIYESRNNRHGTEFNVVKKGRASYETVPPPYRSRKLYIKKD